MMAYRLDSREELGRELRRIAVHEIERAIASLESCQPGPQEAVHDARKRLKKVRAVVRLVRHETGEPFFERENARFRDAGRLLAPFRDSHVRLTAFRGLIDRYRDLLAHDAFEDLDIQLRAERTELEARFPDSEERRVALTALQEALPVAGDWDLDFRSFDGIRPALERGYRRARKGMRAAYEELSPERFHAWRKRSKVVWYHVRLLGRSWPHVLEPMADALHEISDVLGEAHDLAELQAAVSGSGGRYSDGPGRELLSELIAGRRSSLQIQARPLGKRVFAEAPSAFVDRLEVYWSAWGQEDARRKDPPSAIEDTSPEVPGADFVRPIGLAENPSAELHASRWSSPRPPDRRSTDHPAG